MKNIVMISGKSGSGKDFIGNLFSQHGYQRIGIADSLKDVTAFVYGINRHDLDTQTGKSQIYSKTNKTYRDILIDVATKARNENRAYWINKVVRKITSSNNRNIVITDFRFPNEYTHIYNQIGSVYNVITLRVSRNTNNNIDDDSETALDKFKFDYYIDNNKPGESHLLNQLSAIFF